MAEKKPTPTLPKDLEEQLGARKNQPARTGTPTTVAATRTPATTPVGAGGVGDFDTDVSSEGGASSTVTSGRLQLQENAIIDMTGIPGAGGKSQRLRAGDWVKSLERYTPEQLEGLQRQLWEGGFYTNEFYYQNGPRPAYGNKLDQGLMAAYERFITLASNNPSVKATEIFEVRRTQNAPAIANASGGGTSQPPMEVIGTQVIELPPPTDIGGMVDKAAQNVLGRALRGKDRERFISLVSEMYRQQGMTSADVRVSNQKANYPYVTGGVQTVGAEFAGKENPFARSFYDQMKKDYPEVTFLGIEGDAKHKQRKSDHNTKDAVDIGFKNQATARQILDKALRGQNVKYVILGKDVYYPDGRISRNGASSDHKGHVHVSFFRDASAGAAGAKAKETIATGANAPGMVSVVADYPGAVSTPSGGKVLVTQSPIGQTGIEEQIRQENPVEAAAVGFRKGFDVFARLMGGRAYGA